jgi:3-hydroxyacyl-[acyl-carrier-protein] dehydratase
MSILGSTFTGIMSASPVRALIELELADSRQFAASWMIKPDDPIFLGHYPGLPIYPGVCLIESAHQAALLQASVKGWSMTLVEIESARFWHPVFPGHRIVLAGTADADIDGIHLRYAVTIRSTQGDGNSWKAAHIRLRYTRRIQ